MYTALSAVGVKKGINQKWQTIDLATITVANLFYLYRKVYLTLETGDPVVTVYLDMDSVRVEHGTYNGTVAAWLISLGNASLPTINTLPEINSRYARYMDAFRAGYAVKPYHALYGENVAMADREDALLSRVSPVSNYQLMFDTTLVSVNGFYHRTDVKNNEGLVVYKATQTVRKSNQNQIGLLTFHGMCGIATHSITEEMISRVDVNTPLSSAANINTGLDLTGKSVAFVIGGYFHMLSTLISRIGDNSFRIDFSNYPLLDRYFEMSHYLDTSGFTLSETPVNPSQISVEELQSDDNIKSLLMMNQTFIVVLDCEEVYSEVNYVRKTGYPGCYIAYTDPKYPLVTGLGRHNEYWYREEDGQYQLTVYDNAVSNRIYNTVNPYLENSVSDSELPTDPVYLSGAYLMMIGRDV